MDNDSYKEVYFNQYCDSCRYCTRKEEEEPCYECLSEPENLYSHKPVKYIKKED